MQKAIIITGQTGTGKTNYALTMAKKLQGEIISADARQIYKKTTIVTGKDVEGTFTHVHSLDLDGGKKADVGYYMTRGIKLWGYDIVEPRTSFSSHDYKTVIYSILRNTISTSVIPIIVGGTHLYIKQITQGFDVAIEPNWQLRAQLDLLNVTQLQEMLKHLNAETFDQMNKSDRANPRRLIRKIEIARAEQDAAYTARAADTSLIEVDRYIGLRFASPEQCKAVLLKRVKSRLAQGAVEETRMLLQKGYMLRDPGMQAIGYKELAAFINGGISLDEAKNLWLTAEVQYAKRQLSFMRQNNLIEWRVV